MKKTVVMVAIVAAFAGLILFREHQQSRIKSAPSEEDLARVETVHLREMDLAEVVEFTADIEPEEQSAVVPKVPGRTVLEVFVREGDRVKKDQPLASLDRSLVLRQLEEARTFYETAAADYERYQSLYKEEVISRQAADAARARYTQAKSAYEQAKIMGGYHIITAPAEGIVARRFIDPGDTAPQGPVFLIFRQDNVKAVGAVPERLFPAIARGDKVALLVDALPGREFTAAVSNTSPVIDQATRTGKVEVTLPSEGVILPGMFARARITSGVKRVLALPREAVLRLTGTGETICYVAEGGRAVLRVISTGIEQEGFVEITGGLNPDEEVITTRAGTVRDGTRIEVYRR
jgi:membrane fusion protein (multidrug efflux system)